MSGISPNVEVWNDSKHGRAFVARFIPARATGAQASEIGNGLRCHFTPKIHCESAENAALHREGHETALRDLLPHKAQSLLHEANADSIHDRSIEDTGAHAS